MKHSSFGITGTGILAICLISILGCLGGSGDLGAGEVCQAGDCAEGFNCVTSPRGQDFVCAPVCELNDNQCADGSLCVPAGGDSGEGICQIAQLSGSAQPGESCTSNFDCVQGASCLQGLEDSRCWVACDPEAATSGCDSDQTCLAYSEDNKGICQDVLGLVCDEMDPCPQERLTCGPDPATEPGFVEEFTFAARCTLSGCVEDADCPGSAICRPPSGIWDTEEGTWTGQPDPATATRYCYTPCQVETACEFTGRLQACATPSTCTGLTEGAADCEAFLQGQSLCVPVLP